MERRNDDYSDGNERHRQPPYGRPLESFEEPGAETPGPDPISSAFAPITGPREQPFMPVVVPQPQLSSSDNQQPNQRPRESFQSASSSFHSQNDRNIPRNIPSHNQHSGSDRRPTPQPITDSSVSTARFRRQVNPPVQREMMPPPQLPPRPAPSRDRSVESRDRGGGISTTTSTTHNSIEPEFNRTPTIQREHHHSHPPRDYDTRPARFPADFQPLHSHSQPRHYPRDPYHTEPTRHSPDLLPRDSGTRDIHYRPHDHHSTYHAPQQPPQQQHRPHSPYHSAQPIGNNNRYPSPTRPPQQVFHRHNHPAREQQSIGLSQPAGEVHYGHSPMDDRYDDYTRPSTTRPPPLTQQPRSLAPAPAPGPPPPATLGRNRRVFVEVPMETDYDQPPLTSYQTAQPPAAATAGSYVHSSHAHQAQYSSPQRSTAQPATAYAHPSCDPSRDLLAPSANRVFNERLSTRPQHNNEPLYSSLPPPPTNQPNQQVIQPQVAISPTTYHQPPQPPQPNIGFHNYNQQPQQQHCSSCMQHQQHTQPQQYNPPIQHGYSHAYHTHMNAQPPTSQPPPPPPHIYQPMDQFNRHNYQNPPQGHIHNDPAPHRNDRPRDTHMDSDPDDYPDHQDRSREHRSFRRRDRSNEHRSRRNRSPRGRSQGSTRYDEPRGRDEPDTRNVLSPKQNDQTMPNQLALTNPSAGMLQLSHSRSTNELLSLSSVSQQLQMQGLNHTMASMLVPILKDQGVQQGCREMASNYQIQNQLNEIKQHMNESYKSMQESYQQKMDDIMTQQILPTINNAIEHNNKLHLNDAPRTPQSCNSDRGQSRHPDLIRTPDSSVSGTYSDADSAHSGGRGRRNPRQSRPEPYPSDRNYARGDYPPSPNQNNRSGRMHGSRLFSGGNSGGYSSAQSSPTDPTMEENFQPNSISPTHNQYSDLSVDQVCEKLQEWTQGVSDEIIESFRRENIQGRHLNYLTEYMFKKGLLSGQTERETPHNVRPIAALLGPRMTVCRALRMHVGQVKELQTTSTEREAVGLGSMNAVCVWLRTIGLSEYDRRFSEEQVYGSALLDLSESNLIELGMDKLGDRITFMLQREMLN